MPAISPVNPFDALRAASARTAPSRVLEWKAGIPHYAAILADSREMRLTEADLDAISTRVSVRKWTWRFWHYLRIGLLLAFVVWTFFLMPLAALHLAPFH